MPQVMKKTTCDHRRFHPRCRSCRRLQADWYNRLKRSGFQDIEYGQDTPRYLTHVADPGSPGAREAAQFYERAWCVYHGWVAEHRSRRDCRVAELYAAQNGDLGTIRGIVRALRSERLQPCTAWSVRTTLHEIRAAIVCGRYLEQEDENKTKSMVYLDRTHRAA